MNPPLLKPLIEGEAEGQTLFFIQGWPDDHTLWDDQVARLRDRYRCVRVDLPNSGNAEYRRWGYSHEEIVEGLANCIRSISPEKPVTLIAHDWGAYWGYWLHHRHPELVARIVGLDIAPHMKPNPREILFIIAYQWWLLTAFVSGGRIGDWMTRRLARIARTPKQGAEVTAAMNYPYLYAWRDVVAGRTQEIFRGYSPKVPMLFIYGANKPARFHSDQWLDFVRSQPGNEVVELESDHWVTRDPRLSGLLRDWLDATPAD
jgi:pimeloyl-ACP methyl ester carboxylesterase